LLRLGYYVSRIQIWGGSTGLTASFPTSFISYKIMNLLHGLGPEVVVTGSTSLATIGSWRRTIGGRDLAFLVT
jgi:hypothetical protein